jgi:hypothetical protein
MPLSRHSIIQQLFDFVSQSPNSHAEWDSFGQSFREYVSEQGQRVQLEISEHPDHIKVNAGWFTLRGLMPDVRECVKDYFMRTNPLRHHIIYVGLNDSADMLVISTHTLINKDPEIILEDYVLLRHKIISEMQRVKYMLADLIEDCTTANSGDH